MGRRKKCLMTRGNMIHPPRRALSTFHLYRQNHSRPLILGRKSKPTYLTSCRRITTENEADET